MNKQRSRFTWTEGWVYSAGDLAIPQHLNKRRASRYEPNVNQLQRCTVIGDVDAIQSRRQRALSLADRTFDENLRRVCSKIGYRVFCRAIGCKNTLYHKLSPIPEMEEERVGSPADDGEIAASPDSLDRPIAQPTADDRNWHGSANSDVRKPRFGLTPLVNLERKLNAMLQDNPDVIDIDSFLQSDMSISDLSVISCLESSADGDDRELQREPASAPKNVKMTHPSRLTKSQSTPMLVGNGSSGFSFPPGSNSISGSDYGSRIFTDVVSDSSRELGDGKAQERAKERRGKVASGLTQSRSRSSRLPRLVRRCPSLYDVNDRSLRDPPMTIYDSRVLEALMDPDFCIIEKRYIIDLTGPYPRVIGLKPNLRKGSSVESLRARV